MVEEGNNEKKHCTIIGCKAIKAMELKCVHLHTLRHTLPAHVKTTLHKSVEQNKAVRISRHKQ